MQPVYETEIRKTEHVHDQSPDQDYFGDFYDAYAKYDRSDKYTSSDFDTEEASKETLLDEEIDDYEPIGLESILRGICECLEPVRDIQREPTPPPSDPFGEFLDRMRTEVKEGRLSMIFRVPGIGPKVSSNRITNVGLWLADCARRQDGMVGPRNISHFLCPDLQDEPNDETVE